MNDNGLTRLLVLDANTLRGLLGLMLFPGVGEHGGVEGDPGRSRRGDAGRPYLAEADNIACILDQ